jgi:hypothetical protein
MSKYIQELAQQIKDGTISSQSEYKIRSETAQNKIKVKRIDKLQKEIKKRSKLFIPVEIAVPFNVFTGEEDETFNKENKYRPALSATSSALALKFLADENPKVKEVLMKKANVPEWDTTPALVNVPVSEENPEGTIETLNETDLKIFRLYRFPRIFTLPVVTIKDSRITGRDYGRDYIIKVDRDKDTGRVVGEMPIVLKANQVFNQMAYEEYEHIKLCIESAKKGTPYTLKSTLQSLKQYDFATIIEKDEKKIFGAVYDQIPFSSDRPSNNMVIYEIPLSMELKFEDAGMFETLTPEELFKMQRVTAKNKELSIAINKFLDGTYSGSDKHYDFWELDMVCPMTVDDPTNKMLIGQETRYESPQNRLRDENFSPLVESLVRKALDQTAELEKQFMFSVNLQQCDESVENKIVELMSRMPLLEATFMTDKVLKSNAEFISSVYGEAGDEKLASVEAGFEKIEEGVLDSTKAHIQAKEYDFNAMMEQENGDNAEEAALTEASAVGTVPAEGTAAVSSIAADEITI